jgi:hypothetical protein
MSGVIIHGMAARGMRKNSPAFYRAFQAMHQRCKQTKGEIYERYMARGITVCERWSTFIPFMEDMWPTWKHGLSLDRIDNSKGYSPANCRWATLKEQNANRRGLHKLTFKGETLTITEWCKKLSLGYACVLIRILQEVHGHILEHRVQFAGQFPVTKHRRNRTVNSRRILSPRITEPLDEWSEQIPMFGTIQGNGNGDNRFHGMTLIRAVPGDSS